MPSTTTPTTNVALNLNLDLDQDLAPNRTPRHAPARPVAGRVARGARLLRPALLAMLLGMACLPTPGCARERSAGEIRESANLAYERGDYEKALAEWEAYAQVHPVPLASDLGRGKALLALDRPAEAIIPLERVYRNDPQDPEKLELLIQALYEAGETERLIDLLRERTRQPGTVQDYLRLGQYALELGDPDEAERALLAAARIDRGQSLEPQLRLAEFYHAVGDRQRALERYAMALWFDYTNPQVAERIRALGETPGRTFVRVPREAVEEGLLPPDAAPPEPRPRG
ncbi:MAG: hypothetical protein KatS3mg103_1154 [Phycisphaerales bacterium]|nr:MAG: hypothetical protein KatS3mg103_1154 [Phycisphaerales bacterium]